MLDLSKVRNYSQALFEVAEEKKESDKILSDLKMFETLLHTEKELKDYLVNPEVKFDEKKKKLKDLFGGSVSGYSYNFIYELIKNEELDLLGLVVERLKNIAYKFENKTEAYVVSASSLNDEDLESIKNKIEKKTGKKVELESEVDPSIIGGLVLKVGDEMVDLSLKGRLEELRDSIIR